MVAAGIGPVVHDTRIEVHVPRIVRAVRVERTRPVEAAAAWVVERTATAEARCGKEDTITVRLARYLITVYIILCGPCPSTVTS